jgi:hypothetical protein
MKRFDAASKVTVVASVCTEVMGPLRPNSLRENGEF